VCDLALPAAGEGILEETLSLLFDWRNDFRATMVSFGLRRVFHNKGGGSGTDCCRTEEGGQYALNWNQ